MSGLSSSFMAEHIPVCGQIVKGTGEFTCPPWHACAQREGYRGPSLPTHCPPRQEVITCLPGNCADSLVSVMEQPMFSPCSGSWNFQRTEAQPVPLCGRSPYFAVKHSGGQVCLQREVLEIIQCFRKNKTNHYHQRRSFLAMQA